MSNAPRIHLRTLAILSTLLLTPLTACHDPDREDPLAIGDEHRPPALLDVRDLPPLSTEPSITGVSRADWDELTIVVPIDAMTEPAAPSRRPDFLRDSHRSLGRFPTGFSSVEIEPAKDGEGLYLVAAPFLDFFDLFAILARSVGDIQREPAGVYEPRQRDPLGEAPPQDAATPAP